MSKRYTHKIILFSDNKCGKGGGGNKEDALVVMASGGDKNIIPDLSKLKYMHIGGEEQNWGNKIQSALVDKGSWELYTQLDSDRYSQGCERGVGQKIAEVKDMSGVVRIFAHKIKG